MTRFYVLGDDGQPVPCHDTGRWESWMVENQLDRTIRKSYVGEALVSTVFLGSDHNFLGAGPPVLFETMIFGGDHHHYRERYVRREIAEARHEQLVADLKDGSFAPYDRSCSVAVIEARKATGGPEGATRRGTPTRRTSGQPGRG